MGYMYNQTYTEGGHLPSGWTDKGICSEVISM